MAWNMHKLLKFLLIIFSAIATVVPVSPNHQRRRPNQDVFESWGSTQIKVAKLKYTWTIKNFSFCCRNDNGDTLTSPTFSDGTNDGCVWKLHLKNPRLQSYNNYDNQNYLSLHLSLTGCQVKAEYKFGILNAKGKKMKVVNNTMEVNGSPSIPEKLVHRDFLLDEENKILVDNKLIIFCEINATIGSESFSSNNYPALPIHPLLNTDLGFLFENETFSDVVLASSGIEFKAHKAVLAARSPVFREMFELGDSEPITRVEMDTMYHQTLRELLRYMYTDEPLDLENLAPDLLAAAEKYKLLGLKSICENIMSENLTVENVVKFYILSDKHKAFTLNFWATDFIASHFSDLIHTSGFKSLIKSHLHLVEHVFYRHSQKLETVN